MPLSSSIYIFNLYVSPLRSTLNKNNLNPGSALSILQIKVIVLAFIPRTHILFLFV